MHGSFLSVNICNTSYSMLYFIGSPGTTTREFLFEFVAKCPGPWKKTFMVLLPMTGMNVLANAHFNRHGFFLVMSYFVNKKFVKSQNTKNKLALKSEMNGSLLFVLFDLTNFLLTK